MKIMPDKTAAKIQNLLQQAAQRNDSLTSIAEATRVCADEKQAEELFLYFREKLRRIEYWNASSPISSFKLFDENGELQPKQPAAAGNFIKITLPGSGKNDWVRIVEIHDASNECVVTVRPSSDPTDKTNETNVSHFFTDDSTNNFCLQKTGEKLKFYVIGLSEKTNTEETGGLLETVRNVATANAGRYLGIQKTQWTTFCENFLDSNSKK